MPDKNNQLTESLTRTVNRLREEFGDQIIDVYQSSGDTFVRVDATSIVDICRFLKENEHYIYLCDLFGSDRFTSDNRFEVIYNLLSLRDRQRLFVKIWLEEESPVAESVTSVWKSANWNEREVFDMFGIRFNNHPDFRRIFMPEDYDYFPLRKEFPLLGIPGSLPLPSTTPDND